MPGRINEEELIEHWTLIGDEIGLLAGRTGKSKLVFAALLKFYTRHGQFPRDSSDLPEDAVAYVAAQVHVPVEEFDLFEWSGRTMDRHRSKIRRFLGFRECTVADADKLTSWMVESVCLRHQRPERVREELLRHLREEKIEPPAPARLRRMIASALRQSEQMLTQRVFDRIPENAAAAMSDLIAAASDSPDMASDENGDLTELWAAIKSDPGNVSLRSMQREVAKLLAIESIELPVELFNEIEPPILAGWRARVAVEAPSHLREHPVPIRWTLIACYLHCRRSEITDVLVELLIATVHPINARSEKATGEFVSDFVKKVAGKENLLLKLTEASLEEPDGLVRDVVYPAVGGVETLLDLLHEFTAKGPTSRQVKQRVFKASYTKHYRHGLIELLEALEFRSTNTAHQPLLEALKLIKRYRAEATNNTQYYARGEIAPVEGVVPKDFQDLLYRTDSRGRQRVQRSVYECGVFLTLREKLRCKEIWVIGADKWRNPDEDLPKDFESNRAENYEALRKPLNPRRFSDQLREETHVSLRELNDELPNLPWVEIENGRKAGPIRLSPLDAVPEPRNLLRLKKEVKATWGTVPLLDMLTETALRTGCMSSFTSAGTRSDIDADVLFQRLLLVVYAYGTNAGIRAVAADTLKTSCDTRAAATSRWNPADRSPASSPTRHSPPASPGCGVMDRQRLRRTPPTSAPGTRTSSPNGTPATVAGNEAFSSTGRSRTAGRWPSTAS